MVKLLTKNLWRKLRGMSAFTNVTVRISKTKTKRLTVGKKSARNLIDLVSAWIFFQSKTNVSFGFEADIVVALGLKKEINLLAASTTRVYICHSAERNVWLCDRLRSSAIIWKQLSLRSSEIIWKPALKPNFVAQRGFHIFLPVVLRAPAFGALSNSLKMSYLLKSTCISRGGFKGSSIGKKPSV